MAIREKTIIYSFPMRTTTVTNAEVTDLTQITVYIPETVISFTSVFAEMGWRDQINATGGTIGEHRIGMRLAAGSYTTITELDDITHTGESVSGVIGPFDFTSLFTSDWTGTSMTCDAQVYFAQTSGTTLGMINVTVLLYVTYTYDDDSTTNPTQIKTVRIPIESIGGVSTVLSTTSNATFGPVTGNIPQLTGGGILPEATVTIRNYFIQIEGNEGGAATNTDYTISVNIDSGASTTFGNQEMAFVSDAFDRWIYDLTASVPLTTASHTFQMWSSVANRCSSLAVEIIITYAFDASSTTSVLNSILIPIEISSPMGYPSGGESSRFSRDIFLTEPGTLILRQSSFRLNYNMIASPGNLWLKAGGQNYRQYVPISTGQSSGQFCTQQRIDSGSSQGAGIAISRGKNSINIDCYVTSTTIAVTNIMGYILLNYQSDIGLEGVGQNAHTVYKVLLPWDALLSDDVRPLNYSFSIPEANYWIVGTGFEFIQFVSAAGQAITFDVECLSLEGKGAGYYDIYADAYLSDAERACSQVWMRGRDIFKRFPDDIGDRLDITIARDYRLFTTTTSANGIIAVCTYHSNTWQIIGNISGSNGVDNITLDLIRSSDKLVMQTKEVAQNAASYTFTVYNDTELYYVVAYQDSSHLGSSSVGYPA